MTKDAEVFSVFKTNDDKRLVFGWASVAITVDGEQLEDRQQDMIDPEDLESAAYEYVLNFRDAGEEHIPSMRKKGKLIESCVFTAEKQKAMGLPEGILPVGWWIGFKIDDDDAWERVRNGTYQMFSIEGKAQREPVEIEKHENLDSAYDSQGVYVIISTNQFDHIQRVEKSARYDVIEEIEKFNPNHDPHTGQFATGGSSNGYIISVDRITTTGEPNSITELTRKHGGKDRNFYGADGKQVKQISNYDHGKPKRHPFGKHGEHAHDYTYDENGKMTRGKARELTIEERKENGDLFADDS